MKKELLAILAVCLTIVSCSDAPKLTSSVPYSVKGGTIVLDVPARTTGQQSALGMTADPIDTVRVGFIGVGMRGGDAVRRYSHIEGVRIVAICDLLQENVTKAQKKLEAANLPAAKEYVGEDAWKALCEDPDIDLIYICTPWLKHTPMAVYAMECGKHTAVEVPAAMNIDQCWQLVNTCEKTRKHCMMLENCCYDFYEMTALNMAQQGLFGEIYHVEGAYIHNLDPFWDYYQGNWRLDYNQKFRGDNYPTHGIGPLCQVLNIHRGDKMKYLVSMDTKPIHGAKVAKEKMGVEEFADGDHTVTLIRTENGHQIEIQHNVYASRPYSRMYQLNGDKGFASKYPEPGFVIGEGNEDFIFGSEYDNLCQEYKHPIIEEYERKAKEVGGHGGMDFIMDSRLVYCLRNGLPLDEDVYDAAEWSCLTELSRLSIESGSMPVAVPDFTRGDWNRIDGLKFAQ